MRKSEREVGKEVKGGTSDAIPVRRRAQILTSFLLFVNNHLNGVVEEKSISDSL